MTTTPTKNESLPELPDEDVDTERGDYYSVRAMESYGRACYQAALTREAPTEGVESRALKLLGDMKARWLDAADGYRGAGIIYADQLLRDAVDELDNVSAILTTEPTRSQPWAQEWQPTPCPTCEGFCGDIGKTCAEQAAEEVANEVHQYRLRADESGAWYDEGTGPTPDAWHHDCVVPDHIWRTTYKTKTERDHD